MTRMRPVDASRNVSHNAVRTGPRALLTSLLFGVLVLVAALAGAVPASAAGPDALRVTRSVAPTNAPAVAPRGPVARPAPGRSTTTTTAPAATQQATQHQALVSGPAAPADTAANPATSTYALLPDGRGPPALVALEVVVPTTAAAPPGRTPVASRSRAPPASA